MITMNNKYKKTLQNENSGNLSDLKSGDSATIFEIKSDCDSNIRQRLLDLGFVKGAKVRVENISPMGNPVAYCIHETLIALRNEDAVFVQIVKEEK